MRQYLKGFIIAIIFAAFLIIPNAYATTGERWVKVATSGSVAGGTMWAPRNSFEALVFQGKMWIMGGSSGGTFYNDVWSSSDGIIWKQETADAGWPARNTFAALTLNGKMWIMGGSNAADHKNDIWSSSDGKNWLPEGTAPWGARNSFAGIDFNEKMLIMGGNVGISYYNDVWSSLDGVAWTNVSPVGWGARDGIEATVFDGKMWIMGGGNGSSLYSDVWSFDGTTWAPATGSAAWTARLTYPLTFENKMWILGGFDGSLKNDIWSSSSDGSAWTKINTTAPIWSPRNGHQVLSFKGNMWVLGGNDGADQNDVWYSVDPPSCTLTADSTGVFSGETSTLSWTATDATSAAITGGVTPINLSTAELTAGKGSITTSPITGSVTYNMSVTGPGGGPINCAPVTIGTLTPPTGGLVPCGRLADNPATSDIDESQPCTLCAMFYMLKNIINFIMTLAVGIGVFVLVLAGLIYALSAGNSRNIEWAKSAITSVIIGIAIVFIAWLAIAVILQAMGYANIGVWNQVNCNL